MASGTPWPMSCSQAWHLARLRRLGSDICLGKCVYWAITIGFVAASKTPEKSAATAAAHHAGE